MSRSSLVNPGIIAYVVSIHARGGGRVAYASDGNKRHNGIGPVLLS